MDKFLIALIAGVITLCINAGLFMWVFNSGVADWAGLPELSYGLAVQIVILAAFLIPTVRS